MSPPFFSICMPVFNGAAFIERAMASLQSQTDASWELILVDDASTDRTWEIIQRHAAADPRIRAFRNQTNLGQAKNWNECLRHVRGEWLGFLPADDIYHNETLAKVRARGADCNVMLWLHAHDSVYPDGRRDLIRPFPGSRRYPLGELARLFYLRGNIFGEMSCVFTRRQAAMSVPEGFGENCSTLDLDFWMRIALLNSGFIAEYSSEILSESAIHDGADSSRYNSDGRNWVDFFRFLEKYSTVEWDMDVRARQALRATYCLIRYGAKLPRGEFTSAARSVGKIVTAVCFPAQWRIAKE